MTAYRLPELSFDYSALEPHVAARVMELHHAKHHAAYVKGANDVFEQLSEARDRQDAARVAHLERALAFNVSGHVLHSVFWECLSPKGGGLPGADLSTQFERDFGSFDAFRKQLGTAAASCMGRAGAHSSGSQLQIGWRSLSSTITKATASSERAP